MAPGFIITLEGGEGSGKSTQVKLLAEQLQKNGCKVLVTTEPGGTKLGEKIRTIILTPERTNINPYAELFLFLADRAQHIEEVILRAFHAGQVVLCDRFSGSTMAYQIGGRMLPNAMLVKQMDEYARQGCVADINLFLDVSPQEGLRRKCLATGVQDLNRLDKEELVFHERVYAYFKQMVSTEANWTRIKGDQSVAQVHKNIWTAISKLLKLTG